MRLVVLAASAALVLGSVGVVAPTTAQTSQIDASDVQVLPRHLPEVAYPRQLLGASADYVMHNVHDVPVFDGHSHFTVLRLADGSAAWSDFDASPDATRTQLAGRYYAEKIGDATYWPASVRFFDVETHQIAGEITRPSSDHLVHIGEGWVLTTRWGGDNQQVPGYFPVLHRLDGSSVELPEVEVDRIPRISTDGNRIWARNQYDDTMYEIDPVEGEATLVPRPEGVTWTNVILGPSRLFNLEYSSGGRVKVTTIDRSTGTTASFDIAHDMAGDAPRFMALGDGLAAYHSVDSMKGVLRPVDLERGTVGDPLTTNLSHALPTSPGEVAMVVAEGPPGTILLHDGTGATRLADLPWVSETTGNIAFDGEVRARWGDDTTWSIDPQAEEPAWSRTPWTLYQKVTTSGGTTLVNELDEGFDPTTHWRLTWPGGARDVEATRMKLGHGGQLVLRQLPGTTTYQVERVRTGEVVTTVPTFSAVVDGSRLWTISSGVLTGIDVDRPDLPATTVPTGRTSAGLVDVRGRWALVTTGGYTVIDTRQVVDPWGFPNAQSRGAFSSPGLGAGFVVWTTWTYDEWHHVNGYRTTVTDLSPGHQSRSLVDPEYGETPTRYTVDESGSASLAYLDKAGQPRILRLPWLQEAPWTLPDTAAPVLDSTDAPQTLVRSSSSFTADFTWAYSDRGSDASPASGLASYSVRHRVRTAPDDFGPWTTTTSTSAATLTRELRPGQEICAQASATDAVGNTSAWSESSCTQVDGDPPTLGAAKGSPRFTIQDPYGGVTYRYRATDDHRVASYDVQARSADRGQRLGSWRTVLRRTTDTRVRRRAGAGSQWCFRFRARDEAGNVSTWSRARCSSLAIQDRAFSSSSGTTPVYSRLALDGSYRRLDRPGAWLKLPERQVGRTLALWVMAGPRQGKADVYVGGVRVGGVDLDAATRRRRLVLYRMPVSGVVKVVQRGRRPVGVDALAVER